MIPGFYTFNIILFDLLLKVKRISWHQTIGERKRGGGGERTGVFVDSVCGPCLGGKAQTFQLCSAKGMRL